MRNRKKDESMNEYMKRARENASIGIKNNEGGPFGAVIVDKDGKIIADGNNKVLKEKDPTAHAEIVAIRKACNLLNTHDLSNCTLYTSCEPCPMCLSAIIWANIKEVYYACDRKDAASIGFRDDDIYEFINGNNNILEMKQIDREDCIDVMKKYSGNMY